MNATKSVDAFRLKLLALVTMTVDHTAAARLVPASWFAPMRCIGRIAFPIYAFLLVEGIFHTHSRGRYLGRVLVLFLLSEPIYDYALRFCCPDWSNQNILLTLTIALSAIWLTEAAEARLMRRNDPVPPALLWVLRLGICVIACVLAELLRADYGYGGILLIFSFYCFRNQKIPLCIAVFFSLVYCIGFIEIFGLLALIPLLLYRGQRGRALSRRGMQYAFYLYYPLHLAALLVVRTVLP